MELFYALLVPMPLHLIGLAECARRVSVTARTTTKLGVSARNDIGFAAESPRTTF